MIDPKQRPFPGLPTFSELHTELARHRHRDPDAKLIAAYDALLVLCERITVLEAEARKPYMPAARVRAMGGYEYDPPLRKADAPYFAVDLPEGWYAVPDPDDASAPARWFIELEGPTAPEHDPEDTALD